MYEVTVIATALLAFLASVEYIRRAWTGKTSPVPATWILMAVNMTLAVWMYWHSSKPSWTGNIGLVTGVVNCYMILSSVMAVNARDRTLRIAFDRVQWLCLAGGAVIVLFWAATDEPLLSYILVQGIAVVGYSATARKLWRARKSSEPLAIWVAFFLSNLTALYPAWAKNDLYSWIFVSRSGSTVGLVVFLIARIKWRARRVVK